jgi:hypothetical protein
VIIAADTAGRSRPIFAIVTGAVAAVLGIAVAGYYAAWGLTLAHYDAKAHLVVARRVIDSLTPGWQQVGAVWLPLPHLLNLVPVQIDAFYRSGLSGVALSIAGFAVACASAAHFVVSATGSRVAAAVAVTLMALNPNLLYLQSTPMTEALLLALSFAGFAGLMNWTATPAAAPGIPAALLALACLTRYEAWPMTAMAVVLVAYAVWSGGATPRYALSRAFAVAIYPALAILWFMLHSRLTIGTWFVDESFFVAENPALGNPWTSASQVWWGVRQLSGSVSAVAGALAAAAIAALIVLRRTSGRLGLALAPIAAAALPWYAFFEGHPLRIRYMVPLVAASALVSGVAIGLLPSRLRVWVAVVLIVLCAAIERGPLDTHAPMVLEAQWDTKHQLGRQQVTYHLQRRDRGDKILASMGSLAHYMQETSLINISLRDYIHEGNGDLWRGALERPGAFAAWILVEERAEGGDMLAARGRRDPSFFGGFTRVAEGGGVALYRRDTHPMASAQKMR